MGGVDKVDQHLANYPSARKRSKKYYKVFFHLMDLALWNSYLLYKACNKPSLSPLKYQMQVIDSLIIANAPHISTVKPGRPSASAHSSRFTPNHFPIDIPPTDKSQFPTRKCCVCAKNVTIQEKKIERS